MSTVYEIKAHVLPLLNNGSRIKVKIFMMPKNRQGVRQQEFGISYEGKPAYRFNEGNRGNTHTNKKLAAMLHTMPSGRCDAFNKGSRNGSLGCVNLPDEVLNYMAKNYSANDSLYVLPVNEENYIYESTDKGHPLKTK